MATIETAARRGHYVALLDGDDPKMGLHREFCNGVKVKSRRVYKHDLAPGYYEEQRILPVGERPAPCSECGTRNDGKVRSYFAVTTADEVLDLDFYAGQMAKISTLPPLGSCECWPGDNEFRFCEAHAPTVEVNENAPVDAPF